jgi:flagellar motor protein MotB
MFHTLVLNFIRQLGFKCKRSTSIIRVLTNQLGVKPEQLIAAGRSSYIPLVANDIP